jgi:uncharacterized membrane protein YgcG
VQQRGAGSQDGSHNGRSGRRAIVAVILLLIFIILVSAIVVVLLVVITDTCALVPVLDAISTTSGLAGSLNARRCEEGRTGGAQRCAATRGQAERALGGARDTSDPRDSGQTGQTRGHGGGRSRGGAAVQQRGLAAGAVGAAGGGVWRLVVRGCRGSVDCLQCNCGRSSVLDHCRG